MPRKPNYGHDKRRKEQDRKAKKDAKILERQQRRDQEGGAKTVTSPGETVDAERSSSLPPDAEL